MTAINPTSPPLVEKAKIAPARLTWHRWQQIWGWVFLSPWIIGFLAFTLFPIIISFGLSFTNLKLTAPDEMRFIGLENWHRLYSGLTNTPIPNVPADNEIANAFWVTIRFAFISVTTTLIVAVGLAALLTSRHLVGKRFFRLFYYLPYMVPAVSGIFIWMAFLNGQSGYLNRLLGLAGVDGPNWLQDAAWVIPAFILIGLWGIGNAMLTMMAAMQSVPQELYEAAQVDGASSVVKFFRITLPLISPVLFYNLILSVIGTLQYFVVPYIVTEGTGRPDDAAYFFNMHLYKTAFVNQNMGYGATQAWFIFLVSLLITIFLFATAGFWVYYGGGDA